MIVLDGPMALIVVIQDEEDGLFHVEVLEWGNRGIRGKPLDIRLWRHCMRRLAQVEHTPEKHVHEGIAVTSAIMLCGLGCPALVRAWPRGRRRARRRGAGSRIAQRPAGLVLDAVPRCQTVAEAS